MNRSTSPPSSPLSMASRSPSLPADYPLSPPSSRSSDSGLSKKRGAPETTPDCDAHPAKKQNVQKPKELKTEHLNLRTLNENHDEVFHSIELRKLEKLIQVLRSKRKIVVIAGAGISVSAGIPDFRSSQGLFNTLRTQHKLKASGKHLFDASVYRNDSSTSSFHAMVRELSHLTQNATPTLFHHMLATLAEEGRLLRLYSQNVDGIDTALPPLTTTVPLNKKGPWPKTIQLHGGLEKMVCSKCGHLEDFEGALFEGPEPPPCTECETMDIVRAAGGLRSHGVGRLRPRMVLYNEYNPDEEAIGACSAADLRSRPDAVIVVGTSLKVPGIRRLAKELCAVTRGRRDGFTAWINHDPEPVGIDFKDSWDLVVRGECDDVAQHVGLPRWDDKDPGEFTVVTNNEATTKKSQFAVELKQLPIDVVKTQMPTPGASPRPSSPSHMSVVIPSKQSQLPFGFKPVVGKAPKVNKKPGRKPKVVDPKHKITHTFTTSKSAKASVVKSEKLGRSKISPVSSLFPNLSIEKPPMRYVPPTDRRTNSGMHLVEEESTPSPSTPIQENKYFDRHATISPKGGIPSGMENLLT
ncbi:NAD-dependent deacetylase hst4 [Hyphodiscus hymeniophilus]|uniref:NAD-dependent deacetylase hst4 n=1 Tax=Hyphodiscus hymeniophilus TaxID=353542 RepID=A0A9P6VL86_9HELO|nr:NAD-dependent deacetylase hst4 [Hyphodiscus hymeniophilus]